MFPGRFKRGENRMKRMFILILIMGGFLGGYYLGHKPGSPDIFSWPQKCGPAMQTARQIYSLATGEPNNVLEQVAPDKLAIKLDGKDFVFPGRESPSAKPLPKGKPSAVASSR